MKASLSLALTHYRFLISAVTLTLGSSYNLLEGGASQDRNKSHQEQTPRKREFNKAQTGNKSLPATSDQCNALLPTLVPGEGL